MPSTTCEVYPAKYYLSSVLAKLTYQVKPVKFNCQIKYTGHLLGISKTI